MRGRGSTTFADSSVPGAREQETAAKRSGASAQSRVRKPSLPTTSPDMPSDDDYLGRLVRGQMQLEAGAEPWLAVKVDRAAERDRQLARDREPEAGPAAVPRPERAEDPLALLR